MCQLAIAAKFGQPFTMSRLLNRFSASMPKVEGVEAAADTAAAAGGPLSHATASSSDSDTDDTTKVQIGLTRRDANEEARKEKSGFRGLLFLGSNT